MTVPVLSFRGVTKRFGERVAVEDVDLDLRRGMTLGIVGESGSGKTTCLRLAVGLERPSSGEILFEGIPLPRSRRGLKSVRRRMGFVFQDPYESLDPRMRLVDIVAEPLRIHGVRGDRRARARALLASVGLPEAPVESFASRYSGGGRQRIAIARALALDPDVLLCDEPTANLDVSVQAQIVNLLLELRWARGLSMVFVSHDLNLVRRIADDLVVLYAGRVVEVGPSDEVYHRPLHPYTVSLLAAIPADHPRRRRILSAPRSAATINGGVDRRGCVFADRCPKAAPVCRANRPPLASASATRQVACFFPEA